jgi:hypothetical protein
LATIARTAGAAERGAISGTVADPEHPGQGAAAGAVGGIIPGTLGSILRSRHGQSLGAHGLASTAAAGVIYAFHSGAGVPYEAIAALAIPGIRWHSTPSGQVVHKVGKKIVDAGGRIVGEISAGAAGFGAGRAAPSVLPQTQQRDEE